MEATLSQELVSFSIALTLLLNSRPNKIHSIDANILAETENSSERFSLEKKDFKNLLNKEIMNADNSLETEHFNDLSF